MDSNTMRIGELARRTGLTVRTLHHYDAIGLLGPSRRSQHGRHRLYTHGDIERLLRIRSLQQLGMSLGEIGSCLGEPDFALQQVLDRHLARLAAQVGDAQRLIRTLEQVRSKLGTEAGVTVAEFLEAIEEITMFEKYYTSEQLAQLAARGAELGPDRIRAVEAEWPRLIAAMRAEMAAGTEPSDPKVRALARRWQDLLAMFTGGDPAIAEACGRMYAGEPDAAARSSLDRDVMMYVGRALRDA